MIGKNIGLDIQIMILFLEMCFLIINLANIVGQFYLLILVAGQKGKEAEISGIALKTQSNRYERVESFLFGSGGDRGLPFRYRRKICISRLWSRVS
jgi:hypothetical protein